MLFIDADFTSKTVKKSLTVDEISEKLGLIPDL